MDEGTLKGCARVSWEYDDKGKLCQRGYFVPDGKGGCALRRRADAANRTLEEAFFTPEGRPTLHKEGWHRWTARYDEQGNRVKEAYFGLDGRPKARVDEGIFKGCARLTWEYDAKGKLRQRGYFVPDGKGGCLLRRRADAADHTLEEASFTPEGRPTLHKDGYHRWTARYDERGNRVEVAYFGLDGKPCLHKQGYHRATRHYDERGHQVERAYFGPEGKPCLYKNSYHRVASRYDQRGKLAEWACFGLDGKPCLDKDGTHRWTYRYNERGKLIDEAFFGLDGLPAARVDEGTLKGCARLTWEYDAKGKLRQRGYFVPDGKGGCVLRRRADAANRSLELGYFTLAGRPILGKNGYHRFTARYDARGKLNEVAYFGLDGKPCLHKDGYHRWTNRYDERGNRVEEAYFGLDGKPAARMARDPIRGVPGCPGSTTAKASCASAVTSYPTARAVVPCAAVPMPRTTRWRRPTSRPRAGRRCTTTGITASPPATTNAATGSSRPTSAWTASPACWTSTATTAGPTATTNTAIRSSWPTSVWTASRACTSKATTALPRAAIARQSRRRGLLRAGRQAVPAQAGLSSCYRPL